MWEKNLHDVRLGNNFLVCMKSENHKKKLTNWTSSKYKIDYQMHHLKLFPTGRTSTHNLFWGQFWDIILSTKVRLAKAMVFPVVMYGCENWTIKKAEHWRIDIFELWCWRRLLRVPWAARRFNQSIVGGDQSWVFIGRTDVETETPILWPPDAKSWLIGKDPDSGKHWGQEKGRTEDEIVGWHHWLNGHGFGWTLGVDDGQGGLVCYSSWGCKESDTTEHLNWTELSSPFSTLIHRVNSSLNYVVTFSFFLIQ